MDHVKINVEDAAEDSLRFRTSGTCAAMYMYSTSSCTVLVPAQAGDSGPPQCLCSTAPVEPEPGFEDGEDEEGAAEAARVAAAEAAVQEELARARESASQLKEALGKRLPVDGEVAAWRSSLCCLAASAPDFGVVSELVEVSGATASWGGSAGGRG